MENKIQDLNNVYQPLYDYTKSILKELRSLGYDCNWGYFGQHSTKRAGEWMLEYYPIPVITVIDTCEIGLNFDHTFIEGKLSRQKALAFDFSLFSSYHFEVYGVSDYLDDFYNESLNLAGIADRIQASDEKEVGISLFFDYAEQSDRLMDGVSKMKILTAHI